MSRQRVDPVDSAFARIVALTPEQYARLEERLKGWQYRSGLVPAPKKRRGIAVGAKKKQESAAL